MAPILFRLVEYTLRLFLLAVATVRAPSSDGRLVVDKEFVEVAPTTLTCEISIIRSRDETDGLRCARVKVAGIVRPLLDLVGLEAVLVIHNGVVGRLDVPLKPCVRLKVEIEIESNNDVN